VKKLVNLIAAVALAAGLAAAGPARADEAPVDPAAKERVRHLLNGWERVPKPKELLAEPDLDRVLVALYEDGNLPGHVRARAISSMSVLPPDNVRVNALLPKLVADEKLHPMLRRTAVRSFVTLKGPAALETVRPLLAHPEPLLRRATVEALTPVARLSPEVKRALEARLPVEASPVIQEALVKGLSPAEAKQVR
jgi:HEAT repeat protein